MISKNEREVKLFYSKSIFKIEIMLQYDLIFNKIFIFPTIPAIVE